jgi:hypothetical protein
MPMRAASPRGPDGEGRLYLLAPAGAFTKDPLPLFRMML